MFSGVNTSSGRVEHDIEAGGGSRRGGDVGEVARLLACLHICRC